jgi:hypothetical protein
MRQIRTEPDKERYQNKFLSVAFAGFLDRLCGLVVRIPGYGYRGQWFDYRRYQIFWEVVGLERGPLSLVSIAESYLEEIVAAPGLENRECGRGDPLRWPRDTLYPQKLALTSPACGGRSVGIRLRTKATEFVVLLCFCWFPNSRWNRVRVLHKHKPKALQ